MFRNQEVSLTLENVAELLEAKGEDRFRIGAYRNAARRIAGLQEDIETVWREGRLRKIRGVGPSIAAKIDELLRTGRVRYLETLKRQVPSGLADLLLVPGLGTRRARLIYESLGVRSIAELARAAGEHRLCQLPRFGETLEARLLREALRLTQRTQRLPLGAVLPVAREAASLMRAHPSVRAAEPAGSIRRMCETIGDLDLLVASQEPDAAIDAFASLPLVGEVLARGTTRAAILTRSNLQIDLRVVAPDAWGAALLYFTGSKEHNIALRQLAMRKGLKLNEYGLFEEQSGRRIASATEEDLYEALGLVWMPPELRENRGEIEAAAAGRMPRLIGQKDIRGDLHVHSDWSDGADSVEAMLEAARARGYEYIAITDHSPGLGVARGLKVDRVDTQRQLIRSCGERFAPLGVLHGSEVNIRSDGQLDYPDEVLRAFDLALVAIHSGFEQPSDKITQRMLAGLQSPFAAGLAHPTGRLLGRREASEVDLEAVIRAASRVGVALEINSQPDRMDLPDVWARRAKEAGVPLMINTDAHAADQLDLISYGIAVARRAWLEPQDVLNTLPLEDLLARLASRRNAA